MSLTRRSGDWCWAAIRMAGIGVLSVADGPQARSARREAIYVVRRMRRQLDVCRHALPSLRRLAPLELHRQLPVHARIELRVLAHDHRDLEVRFLLPVEPFLHPRQVV